MAPRKNAKRVKRSAEVSPSPEERQPNEPDPISLTGYDDILSEVLLRLPLKRILLFVILYSRPECCPYRHTSPLTHGPSCIQARADMQEILVWPFLVTGIAPEPD